MTERKGPTVVSKPIEMVAALIDRVNAGDATGAVAVFAEDAEMLIPFQPAKPRSPDRIVGRARLERFLQVLPTVIDGFALRVEQMLPLADDAGVVARYTGSGVALSTGREYANTYLGLLEFSGGRIVRWTEFHNPLVQIEAFVGDMPVASSASRAGGVS